MLFTMIVARDKYTGGIGYKNKLIYRSAEDMNYFKRCTKNSIVIMGRKTYESIGKVLPGRINIILSKNKNFVVEGGYVVSNEDEAKYLIEHCPLEFIKDVYIIGGLSIYKKFSDVTDVLRITEIENLSSYEKDYDTSFYIKDVFGDKYKDIELTKQGEEIRDFHNNITIRFDMYMNTNPIADLKIPNIKNVDMSKMVGYIAKMMYTKYNVYADVFRDLNEIHIKIDKMREKLFNECGCMDSIDLNLSKLSTDISNTYNEIYDLITNEIIVKY